MTLIMQLSTYTERQKKLITSSERHTLKSLPNMTLIMQLSTYTERQKKLITSSERHTLKSKSLK